MQSSNPEQQTKRDRAKRKAKYIYQQTQFLFYNQRKKAIRTVLSDTKPQCKIPIRDLEEHFISQYSISNDCTHDYYPNLLSELDKTIKPPFRNRKLTQL